METCVKCGTAISSTAKFCGECGAKIERKKYCPECGSEVKPEQKFCTECGTSLSIPTPKTESKPSETVTVKNEIQTICDKIKTRLEELGMTEFILFTSDYDGRINYSGEPILPEDIDVEDIFLDLDWETYGCFWRQYIDDDNDAYELIRRIKIVDNQLLFDIYYYEPSSSINYSPETGWIKEHYIKHENCTLDEIMDIYEEDMIEYHIKCVLREMQDDGYYDTLKLNKMIAQSKADEKTKKKTKKREVTFDDLDGAESSLSVAEDEIQSTCDKIKVRLEELGMPEFVWFGEGFDGSYDGEEPILPDDVDVSELLPEEGGLELRWVNFRELIRKVRIENDSLLFEVGGYEPFEYENCRLHENFTKDDLVNEYGEKAVKSHLEGLLASFEDEEILNLNKMIVRPKSNEKSKKKSESKTSKKEEKQSKKKSEPKPDKELDKKLNDLYKMGVACQLGKKGVEQDIMLAMDYYQEYLDKAPTSHSKYLDAHYGMAKLCTDMGDQGHSLGMDDDAMDWYNDAVEHYEEILVKYPKKAFNDRLLAEVAYDKLRKKIAKLK